MNLREIKRIGTVIALLVGVGLSSPQKTLADEGMWLFNNLPKKQLKDRHQFEPSDAWVQHLMLSSVRFNSGGSASFLSSNGLVLTNHHVASDTLFKISSKEIDYLEKGFYAKTFADEIKAPDLELNQLVSIEDVTEKINSSVTAGLSAGDAAKARQAKMAEIEKQSLDQTGLRSDVIKLYGGGKYHLYRYKKYTDVRLVWAPEVAAAFFGGDADNFEYPRYCLDVTLFRVYENNAPAKIDHFLKIDTNGAKEGDLVFVSGNPGRTQRVFTGDAVAYQRDFRLPKTLDLLRRKEILLQQYGYGGPEQVRRSHDDLFGIQNSRKAYVGMIGGLQDPNFIASKRESEKKMLSQLAASEKLAPLADAWKQISKVQERRKELTGQYGWLRTPLYGIAETLVLMATEDQKPSNDRLREFRASNRESLEQELYSPAPLYEDLERIQLADELARFAEARGGDHPIVLALLEKLSPRERAAKAVAGTKLMDPGVRKTLAAGGVDAIKQSDDPMIKLARAMEEEYRRLDKINDELGELESQAYAKITEANFAIHGDSIYPDATFTLRLAFGTVSGYEVDGQKLSAQTTMGGAFEHESKHKAADPWILAKSWHDSKSKINSSIPLNFVSTADIIGGNSGSPVVDRDGEFVGIIFDGNIQSLTSDFTYTDKVARSVAVHIGAVLEALRNIYGAGALADQLGK